MAKPDKHILYEASVQSVDVDLAFFNKVFKRLRGRQPLALREDFSGTAWLCREFAGQSTKHKAWGVELDPKMIAWAQKHRHGPRVKYIEGDVSQVDTPRTDITCALNFSYCCFRERAALKTYFENVYRNLKRDGVFVLDVYGGPASMRVLEEDREIEKGRDCNRVKYPRFKYYWEQASFNFINNHTTCYIHFKIKGEKKQKRVFAYHWRLYTLPEIEDLLREVGFKNVEMNLENWDDEAEDTDGILRPRKVYEGMEAFIAYAVAAK